VEAVESSAATPSVTAPTVVDQSVADPPAVTSARGDADAEVRSIGRKAGRGFGWGLLGNAAGKVGSFTTSLVLARLLFPQDFGMFAVAVAASALAIHINDLGLIPAVVQWRGKLEDVAPTAATIAFGFSVFIYGVFWFIAPWFAQFSGVPGAVPVIRIQMITILLDGFTAVRSAYLLRTFQQRRYVSANVVGIIANGVAAISLASAGAGAMSLAVGQVASSVATGTLVMIWAGLPLRIGVDPAVARKLMVYGLPLTLGLGVESVLEQSDKVIVGRAVGGTILGFYLLATNISNWAPGFIGSAIRYVSLPGFSRLSEKDSDTLSHGVQRVIPLLVLALVPAAVLIGVLAAPTIGFLYGSRWLPAAEVLRFLMILMVVRMLTGLAMDILMSTGKTYWTLLFNIGWVIALVPALWFGARVDGARGAAIAQAVVGVVVALPLTAIALHRAGVRVAPIAPRLVRPLVAGLVCAVVTIGLHEILGSHALVQLVVAGTVGLAVYVAVAVPRDTLRAGVAAIRARRAAAAGQQ
jgi:O-antigen/teichoic acid export membrane protein